MTYNGRVEKGVVVFEGPSRPAEGAVVRVEEVSATAQHPSWAEVFKDLIGSVDGLPEGLAENHDHYIHVPPACPPAETMPPSAAIERAEPVTRFTLRSEDGMPVTWSIRFNQPPAR